MPLLLADFGTVPLVAAQFQRTFQTKELVVDERTGLTMAVYSVVIPGADGEAKVKAPAVPQVTEAGLEGHAVARFPDGVSVTYWQQGDRSGLAFRAARVEVALVDLSAAFGKTTSANATER